MRYLLLFCLFLLLPLPLLAVTTFTVNGLTGGTLTAGDWAMVANCSASGDRVVFVIFPDYDGDGVAEAGEPAVEAVMVQDGSVVDEDARSAWVQFTFRLTVTRVSMPLVIRAIDSSTSAVSHAYTMTYPSQGQTVSGYVFDGAGSPVRGAMVMAEFGEDYEFTTITGADGRYSLSVVAGMAKVEVDPNAVPGGRAVPGEYLVRVPVGGTVTDLNFRLADQAVATVSGTVYDAGTGRALPGCDVWAEGMDGGAWTFTDVTGSYSLGLPAGSYTLHVAGPNGWQKVTANISVPPDANFSPVLSRLTSSISGRVLTEGDLTPLLGAEVATEDEEYWMMTNAAGKYQLWVPSGQTYYVGALYPGFAMNYANAWGGEPPATNADILLTPNANQISGRVSLTPSGAGLLSWIGIYSTTDSWLGNFSVFTDENGNYSAMVPPGSWSIQAWPLSGVSFSPQTTSVPPDRTINFTTSDPGFIPTLTGGSVNPARGVAGMTNFVYRVVYTDEQGRMPFQVCVLIDGVPWPMEKQDSSDYDPSDGVAYVLVTILPAGTHNYRFLAWEWEYPTLITSKVNGPTMGSSSIDMPSLTPSTGTTQTSFTASVRYLHTGNIAPTVKNFVYRANGGSWVTQAMSTTDTTYSDGSVFTWTGTLPAGQIEYYFSFHDGTNALLFPAGGAMMGPMVYNISLADGSVSPPSGNSSTMFTFQVTYTNSLDVGPSAAWLQLRKVGDPTFTAYPANTADPNPTDGSVYITQVMGLDTGTYEYYFDFIASGYPLRLPLEGTYSGPVVDASAPTVTISPTSGTFSGTVNITAEASDPDGVSRVEFRVDGVLKATDTTPPYSYAWDSRPVSVPDGPHTLRATAYDTGEHSAYAESHIITDNATFDDVPKSASIWTAVEWVAQEGITSGCSSNPPLYCPTSPVTRGQMAVFLCRAMGLAPYYNPTPTFTDVPSTASIYPYVEAFVRAGITSGCSTNPPRYCPASPVTRGQMAVFLCRAAGIAPYNNPTPTFTDVPSTSSQYPYVEALVQAGITGGCATNPPRYCPTATVNRGQMAVFLYRAFSD